MAYKANKTSNLAGFSTVGDVRTVSMVASIKNENNQSYSYSITVIDPATYTGNLTECRADINAFLKDVYAVEAQLFKGGVAVE